MVKTLKVYLSLFSISGYPAEETEITRSYLFSSFLELKKFINF